nr:methylmalonate-semialdehyde dehydrogenase [acylating], mitochondrial-like isoform X1 [Tanacetum cinerariifolium]
MYGIFSSLTSIVIYLTYEKLVMNINTEQGKTLKDAHGDVFHGLGMFVHVYSLVLNMHNCFGVDAVEIFKEYTLRDYYCWLKTYYCWYKLKLMDDVVGSRLRLLEETVAADEKIKILH